MNAIGESPGEVHAKTPSLQRSARVGVRVRLAFLGLAAGVVALSWPSAVPGPPSLAPEHDASTGAIPVRVTFVDALTGEPMPSVRWRRRARLEPSDLVTRWEAGWHRSGDAAPLPPPFDDIAVAAPEGYVFFAAHLIPSFPIPRARAAALTVLLDREAIVTLVSRPGDIADSLPFRVTDVEVAGIRLRSDVRRRGDQLRGIPFRRGAELRLVLSFEGGVPGDWCGTGRMEEGPPAESAMEWLGRMGEDPATPILVEPVLPYGALELPYPDLGQPNLDLGQPNPEVVVEPWEEVTLVEPDELAPRGGMVDLTVRGTVRVRLLDRSGAPALGVRVAVRSVKGRTDRDGAVTLERVPGGDHFLRVLDEGWVFPPMPVTVADAEGSDVVARELVGGEVAVRVQDADGNPIPFAALAFRRDDRRSFWDLDDAGVRRLDPYVDADGRRVFRHVPPGALAVRASFGSRAGTTRVEVVDGGHHVVTITLPRPTPR